MKTIKKHWKDYLKVSIALIVGMIVSLIIVDANSSYLYNSNEVEFDNDNVGLTLNGNSVDNVQDALSALYAKLNATGCPGGYTKGKTVATGFTCISTSYVATNKLIDMASEIGLENVADAYRYVGADPANYVTFNGELWRIMGVYPITTTVNNESVTRNYLKIVKAIPLSTKQKYNSSTSTNVWNSSSLKTYLNQETSGGYYYTLSTDAKNMIYAEGTWNVGAAADSATAPTAYTNAKKTTTSQKVGLVASYEYLYAATSDCWSTAGSSYNSGCAGKDWLCPTLTNNQTSYGWLMTPRPSSTSSALVVYNSSGIVYSGYVVTNSNYVSPAVYLQSTITINGGKGTSGSPYTLGYMEL